MVLLTIMSMPFLKGSDAKAICYIELKVPGDGHIFGVGIHANINVASLLGIICAINRAEQHLTKKANGKKTTKKVAARKTASHK
jgi:hypothetical protein